MVFILEQLSFYFAITAVLFLPGWFLMRAIFRKNNEHFGAIEKFVISFGLSIVSINFLMILMSKLGILLTQWSVILMIALFSLACYLLANILKNSRLLPYETESQASKIPKLGLASLRASAFRDDTRGAKSKHLNKHTLLIVLILFLTVFIKTTYLQNTIFPTSTDLGHHMYWSKQISETGKIPVYQKIKLKEIDNKYQITDPQPIADFIIGEHLIFSAIGLISGISFVSYFPTLVLLLINILSLLAIFILTFKLFENTKSLVNNLSATSIATLSLFLLGPLWAISSPQAKFVSGGVIGNILGNFFIPLCLYFYFQAFTKKSAKMLTIALFLTMGLFYTHHLSGFIFMFIVAFTALTYLILQVFIYLALKSSNSQHGQAQKKSILIKKSLNFKNWKLEIKNYIKLIFSPSVIIFLIFAICYLLLIYTPAYLQTSAVDTAVGKVTKATRAGLSLTKFKYAIGEPRLILLLIGSTMLLLELLNKIKAQHFKSLPVFTLRFSFLMGWIMSISMMALKPQWLNLNIPSGRIGNYLAFPAIIIGAYAFYEIFYKSKRYISSKIWLTTLFLLLATLLSFGFYDNAQSLAKKPNNTKAIQTFHASLYLKPHLMTDFSSDIIALKDHNYLKADAWIKLFFMQDYSVPFSRSYFKRYNDPTKPREMCTLWMISEPSSIRAEKCYNETSTKYIIINPKFDSGQFDALKKFWKIYTGDDIAIYYKP